VNKARGAVDAITLPEGDTTGGSAALQDAKVQIETCIQEAQTAFAKAQNTLSTAAQIESECQALISEIESMQAEAKLVASNSISLFDLIRLSYGVRLKSAEVQNKNDGLNDLIAAAEAAAAEAEAAAAKAGEAEAKAVAAKAAASVHITTLAESIKGVETPKLLENIKLLEQLRLWEVGDGQVFTRSITSPDEVNRWGRRHLHSRPFVKYNWLKDLVTNAYDALRKFDEGTFVNGCMLEYDKHEKPVISGMSSSGKMDAWDTRRMQEFEDRRYKYMAETIAFAQALKRDNAQFTRDLRETLASQLHRLLDTVATALDDSVRINEAIDVLETELDRRNSSGARAHTNLSVEGIV